MRFFRVWADGKPVADITANTLKEASEIAGKAYPNQTIRVEECVKNQ